MLGGDVVFALTLPKLNHRNLLSSGERFQCRHERLADRIHQSAGGELVATMESKEAGHTLFPLQSRNINVQVHPVDSLDLQRHVLLQNFGDRS